MIDLDDARHDAFILCLVKFDFANSIKKKLNIAPSTTINLLAKQKCEITDIFFAVELQNVKQISYDICIAF